MDGMCSHLLDSDTYRWSVIRAYYSRYGHARASIEGYEQFLGELVPCIIQETTRPLQSPNTISPTEGTGKLDTTPLFPRWNINV